MIKKENGGWNEMFWMIIMSGLYLLEVQGDLGFQVAQVDPEDPAIKIIILTTSVANAQTAEALNHQQRRIISFQNSALNPDES